MHSAQLAKRNVADPVPNVVLVLIEGVLGPPLTIEGSGGANVTRSRHADWERLSSSWTH